MRTIKFNELDVAIDRNSRVWFKCFDEHIYNVVLQLNKDRYVIESYPNKGAAVARKNIILHKIRREKEQYAGE